MQSQATASPGGIVVAHGYGLKVYVERGHLVVHDGIGRDRTTLRLNRATSRLSRLIVIGHTGFITFEAMRWIRDVGATFAQIDSDGSLIAVSAPRRPIEARLPRAQALASVNGVGRRVAVSLLTSKLDQQARLVATRLGNPTLAHRRASPYKTSAEGIAAQILKLDPFKTEREIRYAESVAGKYYWDAWSSVPVLFAPKQRDRVPAHWRTAGRRVSSDARPRKATSPAHALINYAYGILEAEAIMIAQAHGLDPRIGLFHADRGFFNAFAADLMEPARPVADELVLDLLESHALDRGDVHETREGVCRVGPSMARRLALFGPTLRSALGAHAKELSHTLLRTSTSPSRNHRKASATRTQG
jgi:CRISP-associated protein Cas1